MHFHNSGGIDGQPGILDAFHNKMRMTTQNRQAKQNKTNPNPYPTLHTVEVCLFLLIVDPLINMRINVNLQICSLNNCNCIEIKDSRFPIL